MKTRHTMTTFVKTSDDRQGMGLKNWKNEKGERIWGSCWSQWAKTMEAEDDHDSRIPDPPTTQKEWDEIFSFAEENIFDISTQTWSKRKV